MVQNAINSIGVSCSRLSGQPRPIGHFFLLFSIGWAQYNLTFQSMSIELD